MSPSVVSADGTTIGWDEVGSGPPLVLAHGGMGDRRSWAAVADLLADRFSCLLLDRRGRGLSDDAGRQYSFAREAEDMAAVVDSLGEPAHLAGHSSGAICALEAALLAKNLASLAVYEPPLPVDRPLSEAAIAEVEALVATDRLDEAVAVGLAKIVGVHPRVVEAMRADPSWARRCELVHTWPRECREINACGPSVDRYGAITVPTLLLLGTATAAHHVEATEALGGVLPNARTVMLEGQGHGAVSAAPSVVASELGRHCSGTGG